MDKMIIGSVTLSVKYKTIIYSIVESKRGGEGGKRVGGRGRDGRRN